jgi:hypothetical protein
MIAAIDSWYVVWIVIIGMFVAYMIWLERRR